MRGRGAAKRSLTTRGYDAREAMPTTPPTPEPVDSAIAPLEPPRRRRWLGPVLLVAWTLIQCVVPDPHPLGAPEWAVGAIRRVGLAEPASRMIATLALRAAGLTLLGALVMVALGARRLDPRGAAGLALAPLVAIVALGVNVGYVPIAPQIRVASVAALAGALAWLALRRSKLAAACLVVGLLGLFAWGTATGIDDELADATRRVSLRVLDAADGLQDGDAAFARLLEVAFAAAAETARDSDPVRQNRAAILALGVLLGEEKLATVAGRHVDARRIHQAEALRKRVTAHGRADWPRHFWVSAGLTALSDADRSLTVGLSKELMDATPGGTGFSFPDLTADAAGNRFTLAATRDVDAARAMQQRIRAGVRVADFLPDARDLPEGITRETFHDVYGGLGGAKTQQIADEIRRRLDACAGLR